MKKERAQSEQREFKGSYRIPGRDEAFLKGRSRLMELAEFYGFLPATAPMLEQLSPYAPLVKAKFFEERMPVTVKTAKGEELMLRISGPLALLRAYVPEKLNDLPPPIKLSIAGESFFTRRTAAAHLESQEEYGMLVIDEEGSIGEAQMIKVLWKALEEMGALMKGVELVVNASGCSQCRTSFKNALGTYLRNRTTRLCRTCKSQAKRNPIKTLACEDEKCRMVTHHAPQILDFLCDACKKHLRGVLEFLDEMKIPYYLDTRLFREGSWYHGFIFEIRFDVEAARRYHKETVEVSAATMPTVEVSEPELPQNEPEQPTAGIGRQKVLIAEGGRVSWAGSLLAGKKIDATAAVTFPASLERIAREHAFKAIERRPKVFLAQLGELAKRKSIGLMEFLRAGGIDVVEALGRDSVTSQLKVAERVGTEFALILGQKEALDETVIVREVCSAMQETVSREKLIDFLRKKLADQQNQFSSRF